MSLRSLLPFVTLLALVVALPAFPCSGNPNCGCNKKASAAAADPKPAPACDGKCDHAACAKATAAAPADGSKVVELTVTDKGFEPASVKVAKGVPLKLVVTRKTDHTCAKQIVVKDYGINTELPLNKAVEVTLTPKAAGSIRYACSMNMIAGVLVVE